MSGSLIKLEAERVGDFVCEYGSSPYWDSARGVVVFVDLEGRSLRTWNPATQTEWSMSLPSRPGACAPLERGGSLVVLEDGCYTADLDDGILDPFLPLEQYREINLFRSGGMDRHGRFWCTSSHITQNASTGRLYRLHADMKVFVEEETVEECRGLEWSPDGNFGYFANAWKRCIDRVDCDSESGKLTSHSPFLALRKGTGIPSGLTVSEDGDIWVCHYGGGQISRWSPAGKMKSTIELPVRYVTGCCFGGENFDELWVTTARRDGLPNPNAISGGLFRFKLTDARGVAPREFVVVEPVEEESGEGTEAETSEV